MKKSLLIMALIAVAAASSGCASFSSAYAAKAASAAADAHAAQANAIKTLTFSICAVPYGEVILHPEFQAVAKAACLPSATGTTASDLLPSAATVAAGTVK